MIIPGLNIFKYVQTHFLLYSELGPIDQLRFERFEEAFRYGIIPTIAFPAHALLHFKVIQHVSCLFAGILHTSIRVKDHPFGKGSVTVGHPDGWQNGVRCAHLEIGRAHV